MSVEDAIAIVASRVSSVPDTEHIRLEEADGRILASNIAAPLPLPPFTNSAVDGFVINSCDLPKNAERAFTVEGRVPAGSAAEPIAPGSTARIFTGAPIPQGDFTVFMQEDVRIDEVGRAILPPGMKPGGNVRPMGEDVQTGSPVLSAGRRLRPQDIALAAALGLTHIQVRRRIRVAVFSTGDELVSPGAPRNATQIFDSNRFMLTAMLRRLGCEVTDLGIQRDDLPLLSATLEGAAAMHDLILTSGGVSIGEEDHVRAAVESVGTLVFWRLAIKPGKPVAMGIVGGTPFIGLPGNPVASFVTFAHVVRPAIFALAGAVDQRPIPMPVRAAFAYTKKANRREYVRVTLRTIPDGVVEAIKFPREGTGMLLSLVETDGLVELSEAVTRVEPGQTVGFMSYAGLI